MAKRKGRQELLWEFKENLNKLLEACNADPAEIDWGSKSDFYGVLSNVIHDAVLEGYIETFNRAVVGAKKNLDTMRLDAWNNEENEKRIVEMEKKHKEDERIKSELERQIEQLNKKLEKAEEQLREPQPAQRDMQIQKQDDSAKEAARELVKHREDLLMNMEILNDEKNENVQLRRFIKQELIRVENTMKAMGIEILNESGKFDKTRQMAVSVKKTEDENLVGMIAETVSSGYEYEGSLLKSQEVVVYTRA